MAQRIEKADPSCTCKLYDRDGWTEIEFNLKCPFHFPHSKPSVPSTPAVKAAPARRTSKPAPAADEPETDGLW